MEKVLQVQNLTKSYGGVAAVSGLSLSVARGEVFGLLGPNGAGKSTSIECMLGVKKAKHFLNGLAFSFRRQAIRIKFGWKRSAG